MNTRLMGIITVE